MSIVYISYEGSMIYILCGVIYSTEKMKGKLEMFNKRGMFQYIKNGI